MTFAAVGSPTYNTGAAFNLSPAAVGHFYLATIISETSTDYCLELGPGSGWAPNIDWCMVVPPTVVGTMCVSIFIGLVLTTVSTPVSHVFNAVPATQRGIFQEFSTTAGVPNVHLDVKGSLAGVSTNTFPSLTPGHGAGELYWGYCVSSATESAGTTTGFTYFVDSNGNGMCYNPACANAATAPVWGVTATQTGTAILLFEAASLGSFDSLPSLPPFASGQIQDVRTEFNLGSLGWTNVSQWVEEIADQQVGRGKPDESTAATPSSLSIAMNNADGRFFDGNPVGPYYGNIGRNTPVRISVPEGASYLRTRDDGASNFSGGASANPTGDLDLQMDLTLDNWRPVGGAQLASKWGTTSSEQSWIVLQNDFGSLTFVVSQSGTTSTSYFSLNPLPVPPGRRQCIRITYNSTTGVVGVYVSPPGLSRPNWQQVDMMFGGPTGAIFASTANITIGFNSGTGLAQPGFSGKTHALQVLNGIGGAQLASPDFTVAATGGSITDGQGNVFSPAGTAIITNRHYRFYGEIAAFPTAWNATGRQVTISLSAGGLLRRYTQSASQQPLNSVLRREWGGSAPLAFGGLPGSPANPLNNLVAYWPCEDGNSQGFNFATSTAPTSFAPGLPGVPIGTYSGQPSFAQNSNFQCSLSLPSFNGSSWAFHIPGNKSNDVTNYMRFLMQIPAQGESAVAASSNDQAVVMELDTTGTLARIQVVYFWPAGSTFPLLGLTGYNSAGTAIFTEVSNFNDPRGGTYWISLEMQTSGADVQVAMVTQQIGAGTGGGSYGAPIRTVNSYAGSLGNGTGILANPGGTLVDTTVGHITYQNGTAASQDMTGGEYTGPVNAYAGEFAGTRFIRLCNEQAIPVRVRGYMGDTQPMGVQTATDLISLLQECLDADRGMFWEPPYVAAFGYISLNALCNQQVAVSMPYGSQQVAAAVTSNEDDQFTINDAIVVNTYTGGQQEVEVTSGPLSINPPPNGVGSYQQQPQINVDADYQTGDEGGWITWVGTAPDLRYPALPFHMSRMLTAANWSALQELDVGDRLQITTEPPPATDTANPVWLPPSSLTLTRGGIDVLVNNLATTLNVKKYDITVTGVPATPYLVAQVDDRQYGHADAPLGTSLALAATSTATTIFSAMPPPDIWSTSAADVPWDIGIAGEQMTVTAVAAPAGLIVDSNGFETGLGTFQGIGGTLTDSTAEAHSGTHSALLTVPNAVSSVSVAEWGSGNSPYAVPGMTYTAVMWVFATIAVTVAPFIDFYSATTTQILGVTGTGVALAANTWTELTVTGTCPAGATQMPYGWLAGSAPANDLIYLDDISLTLTAAQALTVIRSQNGVVKAQGASVSGQVPIALYQTPALKL